MPTVNLTDEELAILDGKCSLSVQTIVSEAVARLEAVVALGHLSPHLAKLVADVVGEAKGRGLVRYWSTVMRQCRYCKAAPSPAYLLYRSGRNRGRPNYDKPQYLSGVEFAQRFVTVKGSPEVGACFECVQAASDDLKGALFLIRAEVPPQLSLPGRPAWVRYANRVCGRCGWSGHEGQMLYERTLMSDGWYAARCPDCGAGERLFDATIKTVDGFQVSDQVPARAGLGHAYPRAVEFAVANG